MNKYAELKQKYPQKKLNINGTDFPFRYFKNEKSDKTIVFLTGGIGLSDLFLPHFDEFAKSYSVLSFDYPIAFADNRQLVDAIAELLKQLGIKAFLVGQSLGGFIAQMLAQKHPDVVEGMVLSNTGTLSVDLDERGVKHFYEMKKQVDKSLLAVKLIPFWIIKRIVRSAVIKNLESKLTEQEKIFLTEYCDGIVNTLTKKYEIHMSMLLRDLENNWNMKKSDFLKYEGKVLLLLSDDDSTFNDSIKNALVEIMPNPKVITDIRGGHLALLLKMERFIRVIRDFADSR